MIYRGNPEADAGLGHAERHAVWETKTGRKPGKAKWWHKAETKAEPHHEFRLRRDGVLVVVDTDRSKVLWKSSGVGGVRGLPYRGFVGGDGVLKVELGGAIMWRSA